MKQRTKWLKWLAALAFISLMMGATFQFARQSITIDLTPSAAKSSDKGPNLLLLYPDAPGRDGPKILMVGAAGGQVEGVAAEKLTGLPAMSDPATQYGATLGTGWPVDE